MHSVESPVCHPQLLDKWAPAARADASVGHRNWKVKSATGKEGNGVKGKQCVNEFFARIAAILSALLCSKRYLIKLQVALQ